jgi:uncharacterized membrane protein YedE/YeeE
MNPLKVRKWNPYVVGIGIGVLSWVTFAAMDKALGTSTTIASLSGMVCSWVAPEATQQNAYYASQVNPSKGKPMFDWQFFLVVGVFLGSWVSATLSRDRVVERVPALWQWRFGPGVWKRYIAAFIGGVLLLLGARMAGGCTSGHAISGGLQLAVSSWTFLIVMFIVGIVTAFALFGTKGRDHVLES